MKRWILTFIGLGWFCITPTTATIINVPGDYPTIQAGVNAASDGDTVLVAPGLYQEYVSISSASIYLLSSAGAAATEIRRSGAIGYSVLDVSTSSEISGFTINRTAAYNNCSVLRVLEGSPYVHHNTFQINTDGSNGAEILGSGTPLFLNNSLYVHADDGISRGFWVNSINTRPTIRNCIVYGSGYFYRYGIYNQTGGEINHTYNDFYNCTLFGTSTSTGEIFLNPQFVAIPSDFHLRTNSPCIDTGDPDPMYNDPDSTRADMGCFYFDQGLANPVSITLTPHNPPIQLPASGGSFDYTVDVLNSGGISLIVTLYSDVTLPNGTTFGPVLEPIFMTMSAGFTLSRDRTQEVPAGAPGGTYSYNGYAIVLGDTVMDSFTFTKEEFGILSASGGSGFGNWTNTGEDFIGGTRSVVSNQGDMTKHVPPSISSNPFNPSTALSYKLQAACNVRLRVYDTTGRLVETLVDGWREVGVHHVTFDGSNLASGVYLYRLNAGSHVASGKIVLLK